MNALISKSRSKKSRLRDKEDLRRKKRIRIWTTKNVLMGLLFWGVSLSAIHFGGRLQYSLLLPGQRAPATVVSSVDFDCIDVLATAISRQRAVAKIPPVFEIDTLSIDTGKRTLNAFFQTLRTINPTNSTSESRSQMQRTVGDMLRLLNIKTKPADLLQDLSPENLDQVQGLIDETMNDLATNAILSATEKDTGFDGFISDGLVVLGPSGSLSKPIPLTSVPTPEDALERAIVKLSKKNKITRPLKRITASLIQPWVKPNLQYNVALTEKMREEAQQNLEPEVMTVRAGTTLVLDGERITPAIQEKLQSFDKRVQQLETRRDKVMEMLADSIFLLIALFVCAGFLRTIHPAVLTNDSSLVIMLLLSVLSILPLKAMLFLSASTDWLSPSLLLYLFPACLSVLLATILLGTSAAFAVGFWITFSAAAMLGHSFEMVLLGLAITITTVRTTYGIHRRSRIFRAGLFVGLIEILFSVGLYLLNEPTWTILFEQTCAGLLNGLFCAFLAVLLIPLFEYLFGITTDITLLELSDMGNPLLQRLAMEAPGTYHHSLMVANLGAAAALEIGANALAVRVGAYFHDIGKLTKPEFFIENSQHSANPHDDLTPSMSTLVITSHVKEGLTLAARRKMPQIIHDAIQQHHGTGLVSYFYHRACKIQESESAQENQTKAGIKVNEQDYRYPGPRPQTREMAILALADSIEAASRSIDKPTSNRIEHLVNEIVDRKLRDGQLDECDLTLKQLSSIKRTFIFSLTNMLHARISYPNDKTGNSKSAE